MGGCRFADDVGRPQTWDRLIDMRQGFPGARITIRTCFEVAVAFQSSTRKGEVKYEQMMYWLAISSWGGGGSARFKYLGYICHPEPGQRSARVEFQVFGEGGRNPGWRSVGKVGKAGRMEETRRVALLGLVRMDGYQDTTW